LGATAPQKQGYTADDAYKYFVDKAAQITLSLNRQPIQWVEVFEVKHKSFRWFATLERATHSYAADVVCSTSGTS
jgi:hypothetical protein